MIAAIVSLFLSGLLLVLGFGSRLCADIRINRLKMLVTVLVVLVACLIEPYRGAGFIVDFGGLVMLAAAFVLVFRRIGLSQSWKNVISILFIAAVIMLYRYFIPQITESGVHGSLYIVVLMLSGYITSKSAADIVVNITMGIGLGQSLIYIVPHYGAELVLGGHGQVIVLAVVASLVLQQIVLSLASFHTTKLRK